MKKGTITIIFSFILIATNILRLQYRHGGLSIYQYGLIIVLGLVAGYIFEKSLSKFSKRLIENSPACGDLMGEHEILEKSCLNHIRGMIADGGVGYILPDRLVFIPHKINLSRKEVNIFFSEVESITSYKLWRMFDTGLKITLKSGKVEKFVVDKTTPFYKMVLNRIYK